ncbi:amino acid adenylation domain-containing protein, partial [Schlesneria sp.]|uniref:amino acid adenylation domain-containing protein n=1 Tax=Schlesneria sp. TaxID=2762018 RepID=UPI002EF69757
ATWCAGGTLVLLPDGVRQEPQALLREIAKQRIRRLFLPVVMLQRIADAVDSRTPSLATLDEVIVAGEQLRITDKIRKLFERNPQCRLVNQYGPTESHVVTSYMLSGAPADWMDLPPIGRPIANAEIYLLDQNQQPVPIGITGELWIGGVGVARGYWNRPALTDERFRPNHFRTGEQGQRYRTGDLARWRADGQIEFLGRVDHQVKIRGFRVEIGEVEAVLGGFPRLTACAVIARKDPTGDVLLIAYVVNDQKTPVSAAELRTWLQSRLPDYMIPARFVALSALPVNANGKVDRKQLEVSASAETNWSEPHSYAPPRTEIEWALAGIWQALLGRTQVGLHDNFFELGGHSLSAMRFAAQVKSQLGIDLSVRSVFEFPTIERLSEQIEAANAQPSGSAVAVPEKTGPGPIPASFAQQSMWLVERFMPGSPTYHQPLAFQFSGVLDHDRVCRSLTAIMERHEGLRTALLQSGESLIQQIESLYDVALPVERWSESDRPADEATLLQSDKFQSFLRQPFSLDRAPLWRGAHIELRNGHSILAFVFHHSIIDEWSMRLFGEELTELYAADGDAAKAHLPGLSIQYGDYAVSQRQSLTTSRRDQLVAYWTDQLADPPVAIELPIEGTRPVQLSGQGAVYGFRLRAHSVTGLRQLARDEAISLFTLLLASFQVWLARYSGQSDIIVGTPFANRSRSDVQSLIGYFLNTLPIRTRIDEGATFQQVVRQVRKTLWSAFSNADLPFEQIVEQTVKERQIGRHPLYQVMFVLLEDDVGELNLGDCRGVPLEVHTGTSKSELTLNIQASGDEWDCHLEYATDLFTPQTIATMASHFVELLESLITGPVQPVQSLNLISREERQRLLVDWNQTERDYPTHLCIHHLFESQATRTPRAVAAVCKGNSLTYQQLNTRANRLSHHLRTLGVGPDRLVGLCLNRSLDLVVAMLAILKAGGAYVPLDPKYPRERLQFIAEDSRMQVLVTEKDLVRVDPSLVENTPVVLMDDDYSVYTDTNPAADGSPSDLAYLIYTSGSTGRPKGVAIEHHSAVSFLHWIRESFSDRQLARVLAATSVCFDLSIFEIFGTLAWGGRIILIDQALDLPNDQHRNEVTLLNTVPSVAAALLQTGPLPRNLSTVNLAGEPLPTSLVDALYAQAGIQTVNDLYGPSETTTYSTWTRREAGKPATIGRPLANTQVYLLNESREPVPQGFVGELWIGGAGVARGYWKRPDLTAERFVPNPFRPEERIYRTGDLARWRSDGQLEY